MYSWTPFSLDQLIQKALSSRSSDLHVYQASQIVLRHIEV